MFDIQCFGTLFDKITDNGKSIGEGRATLLTISKEDRTGAKCFFRFLNYVKKKYEKHFCGYC